mmetsp:Transcript_25268/g.36218  ORF Transcript_25268/g.36218 Transcript_25268/m.36218 type:complete len:129 (-) Transcript_25268:77-463(-)
MVLDQCIGPTLTSTTSSREDALIITAKEYARLWSKETNVIRIIAQQNDFSNPVSIICRGCIYMMFGCSTLDNSKKENMSYSDALWRQKNVRKTADSHGCTSSDTAHYNQFKLLNYFPFPKSSRTYFVL